MTIAVKLGVWNVWTTISNVAHIIKKRFVNQMIAWRIMRAPRVRRRITLSAAVQEAVERARREKVGRGKESSRFMASAVGKEGNTSLSEKK